MLSRHTRKSHEFCSSPRKINRRDLDHPPANVKLTQAINSFKYGANKNVNREIYFRTGDA